MRKQIGDVFNKERVPTCGEHLKIQSVDGRTDDDLNDG